MKNILYTPGAMHPVGQNRIELSYIKTISNAYPTEEVITYELFQINNEHGNAVYAVENYLTAHNVPYPMSTVVCKIYKRLCDEKSL